MSILKSKKEVALTLKLRSVLSCQSLLKMIPLWEEGQVVEPGEMMEGPEEMEMGEEDMAVEAVDIEVGAEVMAVAGETEEVVVEDIVVVEDMEMVATEETEITVVVVVEGVMVAMVVEIAGEMMEAWEAGEQEEHEVAWTIVVVASSTNHSPSIKACVVDTTAKLVPAFLRQTWTNPTHLGQVKVSGPNNL